MSQEARTVLIVTDDPSFSALISEQMLRAGVQTIRFAQTYEALSLARHFLPDLVLIVAAHDGADRGQECYEALRSELALAAIPMLLYAAPPTERAVGTSAKPGSNDGTHEVDRLIGQISTLLGLAPESWQPINRGSNESEYAFPRGRDDL